MIEILQADITNLEVDAIVNVANSSLLGGGGVDGAIHHAAGSQLLDACRRLNDCQTGEAKITPGFSLSVNYVTTYCRACLAGGDNNEDALLQSCYRRCFEITRNYNIKSIAIPAISTGVYGFPKARAAAITLQNMKQAELDVEQIFAVCFRESDVQIYRTVISKMND